MSQFKELVKEAQELIGEHNGDIKFGCLMFNAPKGSDLAGVQRDYARQLDSYKVHENGIEKEPHITVVYGFHEDVTPQEVADAVQRWRHTHAEQVYTLGALSTFNNPEFTVVKVAIESEALRSLNAYLMKQFDGRITNKFPTYNAHMTVGYMQPNYDISAIKQFRWRGWGNLAELELVYSDVNQNKTHIPF